jgi:hypothetical protein
MWPYTNEELNFINKGANKMFKDSDDFIDSVQKAKKDFVKVFIPHETVAKAMNDFIDTQTEYTKVAVKATNSAADVIAKEIHKTVDELYTGAHFKKMNEKISNDLYTTFWKEAFRYYTPSYK